MKNINIVPGTKIINKNSGKSGYILGSSTRFDGKLIYKVQWEKSVSCILAENCIYPELKPEEIMPVFKNQPSSSCNNCGCEPETGYNYVNTSHMCPDCYELEQKGVCKILFDNGFGVEPESKHESLPVPPNQDLEPDLKQDLQSAIDIIQSIPWPADRHEEISEKVYNLECKIIDTEDESFDPLGVHCLHCGKLTSLEFDRLDNVFRCSVCDKIYLTEEELPKFEPLPDLLFSANGIWEPIRFYFDQKYNDISNRASEFIKPKPKILNFPHSPPNPHPPLKLSNDKYHQLAL